MSLPRTVVVGLGATGLSCIRYLSAQGYPLAVTDSRKNPPCLSQLQTIFPDIPVALGHFSRTLITSAEQLVVSPGVSSREPSIAEAIQRGITIVSDIELFSRDNVTPVLAVTGSNGKTTVTTLLAKMVEAAGYQVSVCGNIGPQVLDALNQPKPDYFVMELSSFHLENTYSLKTKSAVVLNVTGDHMDRYLDFKDYLKTKQVIYQSCEYPVVNLDAPEIFKELQLSQSPIGFTLDAPDSDQFGLLRYEGVQYLAHGDALLMPVYELKLQGKHHYQNTLAALAMGSAIGLSMTPMLTALKKFTGIAHRCEWVAEKKGVNWFNDSKGTNVGATIAAIKTVSEKQNGRLFLIAGGQGKNANFHELLIPIHDSVEKVFLIGQDADSIASVIKGVTQFKKCDTLESAFSAAFQAAEPGDAVLLSPACASLDMFESYEHRGQVFIDLVKEI